MRYQPLSRPTNRTTSPLLTHEPKPPTLHAQTSASAGITTRGGSRATSLRPGSPASRMFRRHKVLALRGPRRHKALALLHVPPLARVRTATCLSLTAHCRISRCRSCLAPRPLSLLRSSASGTGTWPTLGNTLTHDVDCAAPISHLKTYFYAAARVNN